MYNYTKEDLFQKLAETKITNVIDAINKIVTAPLNTKPNPPIRYLVELTINFIFLPKSKLPPTRLLLHNLIIT